jgi:DNA-binding response OmpR family regulator
MSDTSNLFNKILLIEDDKSLATVMSDILEQSGYKVKQVFDGKKGRQEVFTNKYALIIIDISLPGISGLDILAQMKESDMKTPTIVITGVNISENELESFKRGVNIFHRKPIDFELLKTQVSSLLEYHAVKPTLKLKGLKLDPGKRSVVKNNAEVALSHKEFKLLLSIIAAGGNILSRQDILAQTFKGVRDLEEGSVDTLVSRTRQKLKKLKASNLVDTVHGEGYRLNKKYLG